MAILYEDYIKDKEKYDIYTPPKKKTTTKAKQNNNGYFKKSKGNTAQAIGYSALDALGNVTEGFLRGYEGISDWGRNRGADIVDFFGADEYAKELRERSKQDDTSDIVKQWNHITSGDLSGTKSEEEIGNFKKVKENTVFGDKSGQVFQGIGNSLASTTAGLVSGGTLATPSFFMSASGNSEVEALNNGATVGEARLYGALSGTIEAGSEKLFGGLGKLSEKFGLGKGVLDDQVTRLLTKNMKSSLMKNITTLGIKSVGEGLEEVAAGFGNALVQKLTYMKDEEIGQLIKDQNLMDSFVNGMLSSTLMQSPSTITYTAQGRDVNTGLTRTQQQYVNEIAQQRMVEAQKRNARLNGVQKSQIEDRALTDYQRGRLADANKLQQVNLPGLSTKDMDLQQSAYKYGFNPNSEAIVTAKTMLDNRGIKSRFDADAFKNINGNAYWTNKNGVREVIFNPNASEQAIIEEIAIHELTHDLMSSKNSKDVISNQKIIDYVSTLDGYKESKAKLEKIYANQTKGMNKQKAADLINEEIIADTLGKNIGSQEYIRRLIDDEPSIAKNIYDWVVNKVTNSKGVKNEKAYWNNVKNNFEKAYNMEYQGKGSDTRHSFMSEKGLANAIKEDKENQVLANKLARAKELQKQGYSNEQIRQRTLWFQDPNGKWLFEIADLNSDFIVPLKEGMSKNVEELFKHDDLFEAYPQLKKNKIKVKPIKQGSNGNVYGGEANPFTGTITLNSEILKQKNGEKKLRKVLLHELQHQIQFIEGLEKGDGGKNVIRYYSSLGEIQSTEVEDRSKMTPKELKQYPPEVSKQYPIHPYLKDAHNKPNSKFAKEFLSDPKVAELYNEIYNNGIEGEYDRAKINRLGTTKNVSADRNVSLLRGRGQTNSNAKSTYQRERETTQETIEGTKETKTKELDNSSFFNGETRYSLSETGKTGTLMAIHNLSEDKLKGVIELGGFPVPSIAVTNPNIVNHKQFGDISVLFDKSTINPSNKLNEVYDRDVWSPTFPKIDSEIKKDNLESVAEEIGIKDYYLEDIAERNSNIEDLIYQVKRHDEVVRKYLDKNNIEYNADLDTYKELRELATVNGLDTYLKEQLSNIIGAKGIYNGKEYITPSGNRRTFWQLHDKYTLENLVKNLTKGKTTGAQQTLFGAGFGPTSANMNNQFKSIEDIKKAENRIVSSEEQQKQQITYIANLEKAMKPLRQYAVEGVYTSGSEQVYNVIQELSEQKKVDVSNLIKILNEHGFNNVDTISQETLQNVINALNDLKNMPTDYFEAKPQRAVGLEEIQALVIPNTTSAEVKQQLQEAGLKYYEYDPNIEGDRQRVINQFEDLKFSKQTEGWQSFLDKNFEAKGTKTRLSDIKLPGVTKAVQEEVQKQTSNALLPIANELKELNKNLTKVMNPSEIAQLTPQDANTTPILPGINRNKVGDGKSKFFDNIKDKTNMLNDEQKTAILSNDDVKYYDKVTNKDSLDKAFERLQEGGKNESLRWFSKASENADATDVAEGWILLKQYADSGDNNGMVEVAKKLRDMGTKAGQTVQAFNILSRLTPEGMVKYAQSELLEAYDNMVKNKSAQWIEDNKSKFDLQPSEVQFIMDTMKDVSTMEDGYDKRFKLAQIQKVLTDKLPPSKGAGMKAWMRISMLFNPKTQVRNVAGNALIAPVNAFGDMFASFADKVIGSKTGVRTTGNFNLKDYTSGMKKGLYESYNDFKHGVNTRNVQGNRFEVTEGKSFNDNNAIGKALNKVDNLLSFVLDAGDRGFYEASFVNSINNQLVLNNTTEVTQDMIDIATQEALSRTWQDNNEYTKFVMNIRNELNRFVHFNGYGLGDILIPFAKTPANLTKAIVDYSPVGLVSALNKGIKLNRSLTNGQYNAQTQHEFVQSLGKATAGTILYVLGYALAQAGITSGASDEDKDVSNFLKNTLGVNSYSIKIGNKTFTYDWAQPIAAPLSMMANMVQKQKEGATLGENITTTLDTGLNLLFEQSFLESLSNVLSQPGEIGTKMIDQFLDLPSRAVPTLFKQIADLVDGTQRQTYVKDKPVESMINEVKAKIPGLSQTLAPSVDTLGREIQKYGGKNNLFNVFLNPANVSTENVSESGQEIYRLYKETGETNIMPRVAPYYVNKKGEKIILSTKQRAEYQKVSGSIIENNVAKLLESTTYKNMSDKDKASVVNDIVNYSYNIAQMETLGTELSDTYETAYEYAQIGDISDFYEFRNSIDDTDANTKRISIANYLTNCDLEDNQIANLYGNYYSSGKTINAMLELRIPMKEFIKFDSADIQGKYNSKTGKTINGSKKNATIEFVNGLNLSKAQKAILIKDAYNSYDRYNNDIIRYVNTLNGSVDEKKVWLKSIGFDNYDRDVVRYIKSQGLSQEETEKKLDELGFTIRDGRVYY